MEIITTSTFAYFASESKEQFSNNSITKSLIHNSESWVKIKLSDFVTFRGDDMGVFERYLTIWVGGAISVGVGLGSLFPAAFTQVAAFEYAGVNFVVAI